MISEILMEYQLCETFKCLPNPGGLNDQSPLWRDCMHIIKSEISAYEAEKMKER